METQVDKIFLVGFMGSGKSTLGKKIAKKLNLPFFDLDDCIEQKTGKKIAELFNDNGESFFRDIESQQLTELINNEEKYIISLGGGTPCFNNNMDLINNSGASVYLKYNTGILVSRLENAKADRPLLKNKSKEELSAFVGDLLNKREKYYLKSKFIIEGTNITSNQILDLLFQNRE